MSKTINIGKVSMTPKGRWASGTSYERLDTVYHSGSLWISKVPHNSGHEPAEGSAYWALAIEGGTAQEDVLAFLPKNIYVAEGVTVEIYNRQICADAERYGFKWSCAEGKAYKNKFSIEGKSANHGDYPLTLELVNGAGKTVWSGTSTVKILPNMINSATYICPIGGTHTDGKAWLKQVESLSGYGITFVGSRTDDNGISHEGRTGWTTDHYLTESEVDGESNPFYSNGFSWSGYYGMHGEPSGIMIFLGEEEILSGEGDELAENLLYMMNTIKGEADNVGISLFFVFPPAPGSQDGMANDTDWDFSGKSEKEILADYIKTVKKIYETFESRSGYGMPEFIPLLQCFDSENNFETKEISVNPRSEEKKTVQSKAYIPTGNGYFQVADVIFSALCSAFAS